MKFFCWLRGFHRWCDHKTMEHGSVRYCELCYTGQVLLMFQDGGGAMFVWVKTAR